MKKELKPMQEVYLRGYYEKDSPEGWRVVRVVTGTGILADLTVTDDAILTKEDICPKPVDEKKVSKKRKKRKKEE